MTIFLLTVVAFFYSGDPVFQTVRLDTKEQCAALGGKTKVDLEKNPAIQDVEYSCVSYTMGNKS